MDLPAGTSSGTTYNLMDLPAGTSSGTSYSASGTTYNLMDFPPSTSSAGSSLYPFSAWNRQFSAFEESAVVDDKSLIEKVREVLSIKILEEDTKHAPESDTEQAKVGEKDSQVFLSEVYVKSPALLGSQKCLNPSPEENNFFEYSKAILLGIESSFSSQDFLEIHPDIEVTAKVFLHFICVDNKHCTDPKILMKFLTVIATIFSNSKLILNKRQVSSIVHFLLHCLFVEINHVKHEKFRQIVAQMLNMFTNGSSIISKKLYTDIVEYFNTKIKYFPLDLYHWNAILLTIEFMEVSAIQSIIIPNFSQICKLLDESLKSLESYNCRMVVSIFKQATEEDMNSVSQENEIKKFNSAMKTYIDAANVRALLLKLCAVLIEDVIKEDIRTEKRVIYISEEIDDLLGREEIIEPEPIKYRFDHRKHKSFFANCFKYFGDALNARILSVFIEYERSNYKKADFFKHKYKLWPIENRYLVFKKPRVLAKRKQKKKYIPGKCNSNDKPQTILKRFDFCLKKFVLMDPPNPRLGSILTTLEESEAIKNLFKIKGSSKKDKTQKLKDALLKQEESQCYLASLQNVPEPWLRVLRKQYESQNKVEPEHWRFTGNLETYI